MEGKSAEAMWVSDIQVLRCEDLNAPNGTGFQQLAGHRQWIEGEVA